MQKSTDVEIPGYWWTCVAMPVTDNTTYNYTSGSKFTPYAMACRAWTNQILHFVEVVLAHAGGRYVCMATRYVMAVIFHT